MKVTQLPLAVAASFSLSSAVADSLTIGTRDVSYYFAGSGLVIEGRTVGMAATAEAIGDHPTDRISKGGFDACDWAWHVTLNGAEIEGAGICSVGSGAPDMQLNCEP